MEAPGLQVLVADYRRDSRALEARQARPTRVDVDACVDAREILRATWPEMATAIDGPVREAVWFEAEGGGRLGHPGGNRPPRRRQGARQPRDRDASPFRSRPRPLSRVLHAAIVAIRVVEALGP